MAEMSALPNLASQLPPTGISHSQVADHYDNKSDKLPPSSSNESTTSNANVGGSLWREIACHTALLGGGWCDASSGPLIPYMQAYYGIGYTVVSMIFIGNTLGFALGGVTNSYFTEKYGLGRVMAVGAALQGLGLALVIPAFPFPVLPFCYFLSGFGTAFLDAQANTYIANLPNSEHKLGYLHASYGIGGVVCPLAATAFVTHGIKFSYFFAFSVGIAVVDTLVVLMGFKFNYRLPKEDKPHSEMGNGGSLNPVVVRKEKGPMRRTMELKITWIFCVFILTYVGAEVSMGGWIVSFLIEERSGGPSIGYAASGFWSGIVVGRAITPWINVRIGERIVIFFYLAIALGLEFAIWFNNSLVGNAVVVGLIGVALGPIYPIVMSLCTKLMPRSLHASGIGFIAAFGASGAAIFPFLTGALAQKFSTAVLQPMLVILFTLMLATWFLVPPVPKKLE